MALFTISLVCALFGGWKWVGNELGSVMFIAVPVLLAIMFVFAVELLETPLKGKQQ